MLMTMSMGGFCDAGCIILWIASTVYWILVQSLVRIWFYLEPSILHCSVQPAVVFTALLLLSLIKMLYSLQIYFLCYI